MVFRRISWAIILFALLSSMGGPARADRGDENEMCRVVELSLTPTSDLQIVAWIETEDGDFVDTVFITRATGTLGLGNRPGMMEFNSGYLFPYGRRTSTFPVWANRHGETWPLVVFQDGDEKSLSHPIAHSSPEPYFCRPIKEQGDILGDPVDATSCATSVYTDKGTFHASNTSNYPPRADLRDMSTSDDDDVSAMSRINPFDAISRATPIGGKLALMRWTAPKDLPNGNYVVFVEASLAFDKNAAFDYPSPADISWGNYGRAYRGQPSVVYQVPIEISGSEIANMTGSYSGYGDPDGLDGRLREPDDSITDGVQGSGAQRLQLITEGENQYRLKVKSQSIDDNQSPGGVGQLEMMESTESSVRVSFISSGDDDQAGRVSGYEVRYLAGETITDANFDKGISVATALEPSDAGVKKQFEISGLTSATNYSVGVRAFDECLNYGPVIPLPIRTEDSTGGSVDACFIATAAYGSMMTTQVQALRGFRDRFLRSNMPGEVLVEGYYTFGPALARVIKPSDVLRRAARGLISELLLAPTK